MTDVNELIKSLLDIDNLHETVHQRQVAIRNATNGLTLEELQGLTPEKIQAGETMYRALKGVLQVAVPHSENSTMEFEKTYFGTFLVHGNRLEDCVAALAAYEGNAVQNEVYTQAKGESDDSERRNV